MPHLSPQTLTEAEQRALLREALAQAHKSGVFSLTSITTPRSATQSRL